MKWPTRLAWMQHNYDKAILVALLMVLALSGGFLGRKIRERAAALAAMDQPIVAKPDQGFVDLDFSVYSNALALLARPEQMGEASNRVFTSEIRVFCLQCGKWIEYAAQTCPFCGASQPTPDTRQADSDKDGVPDEWEEQYGLDPYNPDDVHLDHDGDGFSTLEEYRAKTNSRDPADMPPIFVKLRLRRIQTQTFKLRFVAIQQLSDTAMRYQLNARTLERTYFAKIGDKIEGYRVESYDKATDTLILRRGDATKRLQRGKIIDDDQLIVHFVFLIDGTPITARVGETIEVRGRRARVESVTADRRSVRIVPADGGPAYEVTFPTSEEEADLKLRMSAPMGGQPESPMPPVPAAMPGPAGAPPGAGALQ